MREVGRKTFEKTASHPSSIDYRSFFKEAPIDYRVYRVMDGDTSGDSQKVQRVIAEKLLGKLGEPKSWKFYLKCAYHLSEEEIWQIVDLASRPHVKDKNRYFVKLAARAMTKK